MYYDITFTDKSQQKTSFLLQIYGNDPIYDKSDANQNKAYRIQPLLPEKFSVK